MSGLSASLLFSELQARGFFQQTTPLEALSQEMDKGPITLYAGFDATGPSFHVGHLVILLLLKWFHRSGHHVIILLGGGTTQVGDPSDKKSARPMLEKAMIDANLAHLKETVHLLFPESEGHVEVVNNKEWLETLGYMDFLKNIGRHFSVNRMVGFEFVRNRLENHVPLSFLELNYMLLQAYDFLQLNERLGCRLQVGGADQWANILNGVELIHKVRHQDAYAITCPLLTTASGTKMGKTAQGAVWLRPDLLSPYAFWQFWRNVDDRDVGRFLKLFTFLPLSHIDALTQTEGAALNDVKRVLADEMTTLVHGKACLEGVHRTADQFFNSSAVTSDQASADQIFAISSDSFDKGLSIVDCLTLVGFADSKSAARRLVRGKAIKINGESVEDELYMFTSTLWKETTHVKLSSGGKKHLWLVLGE